MKPIYILYNALAALGLFYLNGLLGKLQYNVSEPMFDYAEFDFGPRKKQNFSGNFLQKIVNPAVYLAAAAALAQYCSAEGFVETMWLLIPIFWLYRLIFMIWRNSFFFLNLKYEALAFVLSLLLGEGTFFCIIRPLLQQAQPIWIPATELRDALWFAILAYIFKTAWDILRMAFDGDNLYSESHRKGVALKRYGKFVAQYGDDVQLAVGQASQGQLSLPDYEQVVRLVYAIMIYEDFNRSAAMRTAEWLAKATVCRHRTMSQGIMQVRSARRITNKESIELAVPMIMEPYLAGDPDPMGTAISRHNPREGYEAAIRDIFNLIDGGPMG